MDSNSSAWMKKVLTMSVAHIPFFVYGTLMQGRGNHSAFGDSVSTVRYARLQGAVMTVSGIPFVHLDPRSGDVHGQMIEVSDSAYEATVARLDRLEGFHGPGISTNLYDRTPVWAFVADTPVEAWAYLISPDRAARTIIHSGDYNNQDDIFPALPTRLMSFGSPRTSTQPTTRTDRGCTE